MTSPTSTSIADGRGWILPIVLLLLTWAASLFAGYYHADLSITNRVTAVEVQQKTDSAYEKDRLDRIENKLDRLFYEVTGTKP